MRLIRKNLTPSKGALQANEDQEKILRHYRRNVDNYLDYKDLNNEGKGLDYSGYIKRNNGSTFRGKINGYNIDDYGNFHGNRMMFTRPAQYPTVNSPETKDELLQLAQTPAFDPTTPADTAIFHFAHRNGNMVNSRLFTNKGTVNTYGEMTQGSDSLSMQQWYDALAKAGISGYNSGTKVHYK